MRDPIDGNSPKRRGRPPKTACRALILLDARKLRAESLKTYQRRKKALGKLEAELRQYDENDEPEFQKFLANTFGAELTRQREIIARIELCRSRYEKIRFLARSRRMGKERYCHSLKEKITLELDFWAVLEMELAAFLEAEREAREAAAREFEAVEDPFGPDCDDDDDDEADVFERLFNDLFDDDDDADEAAERRAAEAGALKKMYRELCMRYHPDRAGRHDEKNKRLWLAVQDAYRGGNLARLRCIYAGVELESGRVDLDRADLDALIDDVEWSIRALRAELGERKRAPFWGFSTWTEKKRRQAVKELKFEFDRGHQMTGRELRQWEEELEHLLHSYKPKKRMKR